jgi:hypothetical protein
MCNFSPTTTTLTAHRAYRMCSSPGGWNLYSDFRSGSIAGTLTSFCAPITLRQCGWAPIEKALRDLHLGEKRKSSLAFHSRSQMLSSVSARTIKRFIPAFLKPMISQDQHLLAMAVRN